MKIEYLKDNKIISIATARTGLQFPAIAQAEAYWEGLRNGRLMPSRSDVNPRGIASILDHAFILEKIAPGMAKIRLTGQAMNSLLGMEVRGMPISSLFTPAARHEFQRAMEHMFDTPSSVLLTLKSAGSFTRPALDAQMFLAPLKDDKGRVTRVLGALQIKGSIGRAPRRFDIADKKFNDILNATECLIRVDDSPFSPAKETVKLAPRVDLRPVQTPQPNERKHIPGFAEHAQGFAGKKSSDTTTNLRASMKSKDRSYLTLVKDDTDS